MGWWVAIVHCIDCADDLTTITYQQDRLDDAFFTANMIVREHRSRYGDDHRCGVAASEKEG